MKINFPNIAFKATIPKTEALSSLTFLINYHERKDYAKRFLKALNEIMPDDNDVVTFTKCDYDKENRCWKWACKVLYKGKEKRFVPRKVIKMDDYGYNKACQVADYIAKGLLPLSGKKCFYYPSLG